VGTTLALGLGLTWLAGGGALQVAGLPATIVIAGWAFALNALGWVPASLWQTERFYDAVGSLTFITSIGLALALTTPGLREWLLAIAVILWALRLGSFLIRRIRKDGHDGRFDTLKTNPLLFAIPWSIQALWATITALPVIIVITAAAPQPLGLVDAAGMSIWALGFTIEIIADAQKTRFRADPANTGRFITTGLWAWSRHPNYFGEIVLWTGLTVAASASLSGGQWAAWASPVLVTLLLTRISGIPLLEARAEERWGDDPGYRAYVARTPALLPRPPTA
jgi:steroid 5-alpha reductase family enzyme